MPLFFRRKTNKKGKYTKLGLENVKITGVNRKTLALR